MSSPDCELCGSALAEGRCPVCSDVERERFRSLQAGSFPANALPPSGMILGPGLARLRRALANQDLMKAEELWTELLRSVQPLGARGRGQLADCFEAFANLKEALGKPQEAERFRGR